MIMKKQTVKTHLRPILKVVAVVAAVEVVQLLLKKATD
jgi:DNA-binding CsgD family transcriptional regulator